MIVGIGMDLAEISRFHKLLEKPTASRFLERVLTPRERELCEQRKNRLAEYVAGRFAAKESVAKALGTGIGAAVSFQDIEIVNGDCGQPVCQIDRNALVRAGVDPAVRIHLSITHTEMTAAAFVVIERLP